MLSEISQKEKDKYSTISYLWNLKSKKKKKKKLIDKENRLVVARGRARAGCVRMGKLCFLTLNKLKM